MPGVLFAALLQDVVALTGEGASVLENVCLASTQAASLRMSHCLLHLQSLPYFDSVLQSGQPLPGPLATSYVSIGDGGNYRWNNFSASGNVLFD